MMRAQQPQPYRPENEYVGLKAILKSISKREIVRVMGLGTPAITSTSGHTTSVTVFINTWSETYLLVRASEYGNTAVVNLNSIK